MLDREKVWVSDPHEGFVLGRIIDLTEEGAVVERVEGKRLETAVTFDQIYPCEDDEQKDVDDNCGLMYLNEVSEAFSNIYKGVELPILAHRASYNEGVELPVLVSPIPFLLTVLFSDKSVVK